MTIVFTAARTRLTLGPELARGGEGIVYRVRERPELVAKLHQPAPTVRAVKKLEAMLARRPADPTAARLGHTSIAWPTEMLHDAQGGFVGFLMPGIFDGRPLVDVYNRKRRAQVLPDFDRRYLHRTAANFAAAVGALHAHGLVVGDLNESNVLVRPNALVTLIDTDSYQVPNRRGRQPLIFPCPVGKVEFTPPELQGRPFAGVVRTQEHDRFALAVLIFQLLMEGSHPFRARWLGQDEPPSTDQKISQGLFPHARPAPVQLEPPPGLPPLDVLHPDVVALVGRCFVDGHRDPSQRPAPAEWERALGAAERALVRCRNGHYYGGHLAGCPWCGAGGDRRPAARPRAVREPDEPTRRRPIAVAPSAPPRSAPLPARPSSSRHAWRDAMMVTVAAILILSMVTTNVFGLRQVPVRSDPPPTVRVVQPTSPAARRAVATRSSDAIADNLPLDLAVGTIVRVTSDFPVSLAPFAGGDLDEGVVTLRPGSLVEIAGEAERVRGEIWWPVVDQWTRRSGYVLQGTIDAPKPRG